MESPKAELLTQKSELHTSSGLEKWAHEHIYSGQWQKPIPPMSMLWGWMVRRSWLGKEMDTAESGLATPPFNGPK